MQLQIHHKYIINTKDNINFLKKKGVMAGIHYPLPVHLHPTYKDRVMHSRDMSVTESIVKKIISLPIYPELSKIDSKLIVNSLHEFFK